MKHLTRAFKTLKQSSTFENQTNNKKTSTRFTWKSRKLIEAGFLKSELYSQSWLEGNSSLNSLGDQLMTNPKRNEPSELASFLISYFS